VHPDRVVEAALDLYPGARMPGRSGQEPWNVRVVSTASFLH